MIYDKLCITIESLGTLSIESNEGSIPHFHLKLFSGDVSYIALNSAKYLPGHNSYRLNAKQRDLLENGLKCYKNGTNQTNFEYLLKMWNAFNRKEDSFVQPNYLNLP